MIFMDSHASLGMTPLHLLTRQILSKNGYFQKLTPFFVTFCYNHRNNKRDLSHDVTILWI